MQATNLTLDDVIYKDQSRGDHTKGIDSGETPTVVFRLDNWIKSLVLLVIFPSLSNSSLAGFHCSELCIASLSNVAC